MEYKSFSRDITCIEISFSAIGLKSITYGKLIFQEADDSSEPVGFEMVARV